MNKCKLIILLLFLLFIAQSSYAQVNEIWKEQLSKDGNTRVKSKVYSVELKKFIEYEASTVVKADFEACTQVIKNIENHKIIINEQESKLLDSISANELLIYYYFNPFWPFKDSDCVAKMTYHINHAEGTAIFYIKARPEAHPLYKIKRLTDYDMSFTLTKISNDKIKLCTKAKISPAIQVPRFMLKAFFPKGPTDILQRIVKLSEKG